MSTRVFSVIYKEIRGLHHAAYILALFTFGSQVLALVRDRLLAHQFGAGFQLDLYYTAFRIPDVLYVLFASMLSAYILIPIIAEKEKEEGNGCAQAFLSQLFTFFCVCYTVVGSLIFVFAPYLVAWLFPGFQIYTDTLVLLIRILLLQPLLLGISGIFGVVTQLEQRFVLYALSPLMYNLGIIGGVIFLYPVAGLPGIVVGVVLGAMGHLLIQVPFLYHNRMRPRLTRTFDFSAVHHVIRASYARVIALSLHQWVLLLFVSFASVMAVGSVSVFQFAYNLQSVPLAIIGVSYSVAAFPLMAKLNAQKDFAVLRSYILSAVRHIIFWSVPVLVLCIVVRAQFVRVVLGSGAFDWDDTRLTAALFALFIVSLTAQALHVFFVRAFYALGNTRIPLYTTLASSGIALFGAYVLYMLLHTQTWAGVWARSLLRLDGVVGYEVLALPLAYSCALIIHMILLVWFARRIFALSLRALVAPSCTAVASAIAGGVLAYYTLMVVSLALPTTTVYTLLIQGGSASVVGFVVYFACQYVLRNTEIREIMVSLRHRSPARPLVPPQTEDTLTP